MIKAIDIDFDNGRMFLAAYESGTIYEYRVTTPISPEGPVELVHTYNGGKFPLCIAYWRDRDEIYVGHRNGSFAIYELENLTAGPICKLDSSFSA